MCRPPGHHVGRDFYGGSCYLNNAAIAAQRMRSGGIPRVGIVDLDAHHGNGTQEIFYQRSDVVYGSVHVDPGAGWFPHFAGYDDETGEADGAGANLNLPLPPGTGDAEWLRSGRPVDRFRRRPPGRVRWWSRWASMRPGTTRRARCRSRPRAMPEPGRMIGELGLPTVFVQEGGYHLDSLGRLVLATLLAFEGEKRERHD